MNTRHRQKSISPTRWHLSRVHAVEVNYALRKSYCKVERVVPSALWPARSRTSVLGTSSSTFDCFVTSLTAELVAAGMSREDATMAALARVDELVDISSMLDLLAHAAEADADCDQAA